MEFRVTVGLGQDSVEVDTLERRGAALQECVRAQPGAADAVVVVDLVKATTGLVVAVDAEDALAAAAQVLALTRQGLAGAGVGAPRSIVTVEAEAVPGPAHDQVLRPHAVQVTDTAERAASR